MYHVRGCSIFISPIVLDAYSVALYRLSLLPRYTPPPCWRVIFLASFLFITSFFCFSSTNTFGADVSYLYDTAIAQTTTALFFHGASMQHTAAVKTVRMSDRGTCIQHWTSTGQSPSASWQPWLVRVNEGCCNHQFHSTVFPYTIIE